jgi:hypothetical protein
MRSDGRTAALRCGLALCVAGLASWPLPSGAESCGPAPVHKKELQRSDIVAVGLLRILDISGQPQDAGTMLISGTAQLRVLRVDRNRTSLAGPFRFSFEYWSDSACSWGPVVVEGQRATVHLKLVSPRARELKAMAIGY